MKQTIVLLMFVAFIGFTCKATPTVQPTKATCDVVTNNPVTINQVNSDVNTFVVSDYTMFTYTPLANSKYISINRWYNKPSTLNRYLNNQLLAKGKKGGGKKGGKGKKC
jgi:hypothetical protein